MKERAMWMVGLATVAVAAGGWKWHTDPVWWPDDAQVQVCRDMVRTTGIRPDAVRFTRHRSQVADGAEKIVALEYEAENTFGVAMDRFARCTFDQDDPVGNAQPVRFEIGGRVVDPADRNIAWLLATRD